MKNGRRRIFFFVVYTILLILLTAGPFVPNCRAEEEEVYVEINKLKNTLTVYVNDTPVYLFPVATGRTAWLTPEGEFQIVTRVKNPWYVPRNIAGGDPKNPLGTRWMGINVPGSNGYKYGIHGTNDEHTIGSSVSSGCIRMRNEDVEWLFNHLPLHTRVLIK